MEMNDLSYTDIEVGRQVSFSRKITERDMGIFAELTGDLNPLHRDRKYASSRGFADVVVYGMLAGSLFSALVGMLCPGKRCLYLSQSLYFRKPLYPGDELVVRGVVKEKIDSVQVIIISTDILKQGSVSVSGEAKVKIFAGG